MSKPIPEFDIDPFSHESVRNARAVDDRLRELAPVTRGVMAPMVLLYFAGIGVSALVVGKRNRRRAAH